MISSLYWQVITYLQIQWWKCFLRKLWGTSFVWRNTAVLSVEISLERNSLISRWYTIIESVHTELTLIPALRWKERYLHGRGNEDCVKNGKDTFDSLLSGLHSYWRILFKIGFLVTRDNLWTSLVLIDIIFGLSSEGYPLFLWSKRKALTSAKLFVQASPRAQVR